MLNKVIEAIKSAPVAKHLAASQIADIITDATAMYNAGFDALEDGTVIAYQNNIVIVKQGNTYVRQEMYDNFGIRSGKLTTDVKRVIDTKDIPEDKKTGYLAQAIITKYYTIKEA